MEYVLLNVRSGSLGRHGSCRSVARRVHCYMHFVPFSFPLSGPVPGPVCSVNLQCELPVDLHMEKVCLGEAASLRGVC